MKAYAVEIIGLKDLGSEIPDSPKILKAASAAINDTLRRTRTASARAIQEQVKFPASYLNASSGKLKVTEFAAPGSLEGRISARSRPTSLARFVIGGAIPGKRGGVHLQVKPGVARFSKRMFAIKLRQGDFDIDDKNYNVGLAIRLRPGEIIEGRKKQIKMMQAGAKSALYLLYGPSVDQIFRTVREDQVPEAEQYLETRFLSILDAMK